MGILTLSNMEFYARHGHYHEEQLTGGRYCVDLSVETDTDAAEMSDNLTDALDYSRLYEAVKHEMEIPSHLVEHLARRIMNAILKISDRITRVTLTVSKLNPPVGGQMDRFSITLTQ